MLFQTLFAKLVGIVGQIVTAWFLSPHDFKLVVLAYTVSGYASLVRDAGLQTILVQRQKHLRRWIGPVFWMSITLGTGTAIATAAAAPFAAWLFGAPELKGLVYVIALAGFFSALSMLPGALLQIQLRFRFQAVTALISALMLQAVSMFMAWRGYGAYSYIVAFALTNAFTAAAYWWGAKVKIKLRAHLRRWRLLLPDSGTIILINLVGMAVSNGDYLALGLFHKADNALGIFYFAFNLSWQMLVVLSANLGNVLYPTMGKLQHDPRRMMQAYFRSARALMLIAAPACLLQAAVTNPGFHLVFKPKWYPAIPVTQALCLGMTVRTVGITVNAINMSRGRFRVQLLISSIYTIIFLLSMGLASKFSAAGDAALVVAIAEGGFYLVLDPIIMGIIFRLNGERGAKEVVRILRAPIICGAIGAALGVAAAHFVPDFRGQYVAKIAVTTLVMAAFYIPVVRKLAPEDWNEIQSLLKRRKAA